MRTWSEIAVSALVSGTVASITSTAALALAAKVEGRSPIQPTNSTSHWLHGEQAGAVDRPTTAHTLPGYATHHAAALFWAMLFETLMAGSADRRISALLKNASIVSAVAAVVDYGVVPKPLTPGWEAVLSKRSIAAAYVAMALGLALGGSITNRSDQQRLHQQSA